VPELALKRVSPGQYALDEIGTLRALPRFASVIEAGGVSWTLRRAAGGFGQTIRAVETASGSRVSTYVPNGFLNLRGIYAGTLTHGERQFEWRANRQLGRQFTLSEADASLAHFVAGSVAQPVSVSIEQTGRLEPLVVLFCCHIVKQVIETARFGLGRG
jgi:hypothetical protein